MELINITKYLVNGFIKYNIEGIDGEGNPIYTTFDYNSWNRSKIVSELIRSKYSQDRVEAIINNHFLAIGEWLEKKLAGSTEAFVDEEYDKLQEWRQICKQWADEALAKYPPVE